MTDVKQTDIFSTFGLHDEVAEERQREEEERKRKIEEAKKNAPQNPLADKTEKPSKKEEFELNLESFIFHLGQQISILEYFTEEEIENGVRKNKKGEEVFVKIDGEEVRKRLEKDYPNLVKSHTQVVFLAKKNMLMCIQISKKKGCSEGASSSEGSFSPVKIPSWILNDFIFQAKKIYQTHQSELHADIYLNTDTKEFILDFPSQWISSVNCEVTETAEEQALKLIEWSSDSLSPIMKVMEIHSHHQMLAIPSKQDDESERLSNVLYAIVGEIDQLFPSIIVRVFNETTQSHLMINPSKVFESPLSASSNPYSLDLEVMNKGGVKC
ncbi:hypothetical protein HLI_21290 (plasmid) [Halobacillus litoralis]|uniref:Uncharacterized protein n=2 Tax=Halobacillus litoralis TaxID=45668 RepID=A0A410MJ88_9BACI|nr:hypothetical protein HLI_21290 [Halobacillus litoralis]